MAGQGFPERSHIEFMLVAKASSRADSLWFNPTMISSSGMKTLEEFKKVVAYVAMSKRENQAIEHLARLEYRSKSNMIRSLVLEALQARVLAQRSSA